MNEQTETKANQPSAAMGLLLAPLAVLLALATTQVVGIEYDLTANNMMPMLVVAIASMLAVVPRIVRESVPDLSTSTVSLGVLVVAFVGAEALYMLAGVDAFAALMFAIIVLVGSNLDMRGRHEWMTALAFGAVGFWLALAAANTAYGSFSTVAGIDDVSSIIQLDNGEYRSTMNLERQAAAYVFFAYLTLSVAAGLLAGDVVAAAVILDPNIPIDGLNDSKKLTGSKREELGILIREHALAVAIGRSNVQEIDTLNILQASLLAMRRSVEALPLTPHMVYVDGNHIPTWQFQSKCIVRGDAKIPAIAAASILAKVTRDREMEEWDNVYPGYGLSKHKGYPTKQHLDALAKLGPSPIHRRSFAPVSALLR